MKKTILLSTLVLCSCFMLSLSAQEFTLYGEGIMPTGRYGTSAIARDGSLYRPVSAITDTNNALGGASYGWGAGFQMAFPMATKGVDLVFDAGFRMNWLDSTMRNYFDDYAYNNHSEGITTAPRYYNIPLTVGPRFTFELAEGFGIYANLLLGVDIRIISDAIYDESCFVDYYTAFPLTFRAAAGILLFDHLRLEANWSWMGDDLVEATLYDGAYHDHGIYGALETMHMGLRLGWSF